MCLHCRPETIAIKYVKAHVGSYIHTFALQLWCSKWRRYHTCTRNNENNLLHRASNKDKSMLVGTHPRSPVQTIDFPHHFCTSFSCHPFRDCVAPVWCNNKITIRMKTQEIRLIWITQSKLILRRCIVKLNLTRIRCDYSYVFFTNCQASKLMSFNFDRNHINSIKRWIHLLTQDFLCSI